MDRLRDISLPARRPVDSVMAARRADSFGKRSIKASSKEFALRLAISMTDLTTLEGKDSPEKVRSLCRKAISPAPVLDRVLLAMGAAPVPSVAAICVYPNLVAVAREALAPVCLRAGGLALLAIPTKDVVIAGDVVHGHPTLALECALEDGAQLLGPSALRFKHIHHCVAASNDEVWLHGLCVIEGAGLAFLGTELRLDMNIGEMR